MTGQTAPEKVEEEVTPTSTASPFSVIGWTLFCFALIPLTMAGHGDGHGYTIVGVGLGAASIVCIVLGKLMGRKRDGQTNA
jgi:hypothetical protein